MITRFLLELIIEAIDMIIAPIELMMLDSTHFCWTLDVAVILLIILAIV